MKQLLYSLSVLFLGTGSLGAITLAPGPGCDTLLTTDGRTILIHEVSRSATELRYYACDDASQTVITLPASAVKLVLREGHYQKALNRKQKEEEAEARISLQSKSLITLGMGILSMVSLVLTVLFGGTFILMTLLAGLWAILLGYFTLRRLRGKNISKKIESRLRTGMIFGAIGLGAIIAAIFLV